MIKVQILIACLFLTSYVKAQEKYIIKGHIRDLKDNTVVLLYEDNGDIMNVIVRDTVKAGKFTFSGVTDQKKCLMVIGEGDGFPSMWLDVWVGPGSAVQIEGIGKLLKTWDVKSDVPEQKEWNRYISASRVYYDHLQQLSVEVGCLLQRRHKAKAPEIERIGFAIDSLRTKEDSLRTLINRQDLQILSRSAVSPIWMNKLVSLSEDVRYNDKSLFREPVQGLYNKLSREHKESEAGREIKANLFPPAVVKTGEPMADTVFHDLSGKEHSLSEYKGKFLLLDFWSMACGPCIASVPELKEISESMKDSLTVISLSVDTKKKLWQEASETEKISWVNLSDGEGMNGIAARYGVDGIPHYVVVSPEGIVLDSWEGYSKGRIREKLRKLKL